MTHLDPQLPPTWISGDCEWNPARDEPATTTDRSTCGPAVWSVGAGRENNYHLCETCARLPRFKRLRRRVRLARGSADVTH